MARAWATIEVARLTAGSWNPAQRSASGGRSRRLTSAVVRPRRSSSSRAVSSAAAQREGVAGLPAIVTTSIMAPPEPTVTVPRFRITLSTYLVDIGDINSPGSCRQEVRDAGCAVGEDDEKAPRAHLMTGEGEQDTTRTRLGPGPCQDRGDGGRSELWTRARSTLPGSRWAHRGGRSTRPP